MALSSNETVTGAKMAINAVDQYGHDRSLRKWYAALANRHVSNASIVVMGDSNAEGTGVSSSINRRWQVMLQAQLRSRFQPSGVAGALVPYISAFPKTPLIPSDYGRTATAGVTSASYGLGMRAASVPTGESVTFTFTGTRAKLFGTKGPSVGRYSIRLDGAAEVVVDGFNSGSIINGQQIWDSGTLTAGAHTVVVARATSTTANPGIVFPEGLFVYNGDESAGIRVVDSAKHGSKISDFLGTTNVGYWSQAFSSIENKGLLIIPWGANDVTSGTTVTQFRADLEAVIAATRANGFNGSILLVHMPKRGTADEAMWSSYLAQMEAVADADPDVSLLNLRERIPDNGSAEANTLGIYFDEVHYNEKGQGMIADQIASALIPH